MFNLKEKLQKTRENLVNPLKKIFQRGGGLSEDESLELEELLLSADIGVEACDRIMDTLREVTGESDYREELIRKGFKNVVRFNPYKIAAQYAALYNSL